MLTIPFVVYTIFRYLYRADLRSSVEFGAFLEAFCQDTARAYLGEAAPRLEIEVDRQEIPLEQALSLALMTHELITNGTVTALGSMRSLVTVNIGYSPGRIGQSDSRRSRRRTTTRAGLRPAVAGGSREL